METTSPGRDTPDSLLNRIRTGLSQSSVSLSSLTGPNYCYGNQQGYDTGSHGYPLYYGYLNDDVPQRLENINNKPKITSAVYKNRAYSKGSIDLLPDGPLLSDLYMNDPIQEEQIRLGNSSNDNQKNYTNDIKIDLTTCNEIKNKKDSKSTLEQVKVTELCSLENGKVNGKS